MALRISTFPDTADTTQRVTLDGVDYDLRLVWRHRLQGWYMDLAVSDGSATVVKGARLSPGWDPLFGRRNRPGAPQGMFFVRGVDGYRREDLGVSLLLTYYEADRVAELAASIPPTPAVTVEVL